MQDLIFVSLENWDEVWRRNQFLCAGLARRFPGSKILFVGLPRDISNDLRHGRMPHLGGGDETVPGLPNVTLTRPPKLLPNTLALGRRFNEALFRAHVKGAARRLGLRSPLLWLNPHSAVHLAGRAGERAVVYDITDDWTTLTQSPALTEMTVAQDAALCRRADAVIVCSERLFAMKRGLTPSLRLIPNGVDADHYRRVLDGDGPLPAALADRPRPVLGYTGTVHPDRVDVPLVEDLARRLPQATVALVGPNMLEAADRARLAACPNVVLTGPVPYAQVPDFMRAFDVCITPHRVTAFTESLNPIKLWEYLAAGKPIVSTDVAGFRDFPQFVRIASDAAHFVQAVQAALGEDPAVGEARRAEARRNSWDARIDDVLRVMDSCPVVPASVDLEGRGNPPPAVPADPSLLRRGEEAILTPPSFLGKGAGGLGSSGIGGADPLLSVIIVSYNTRQMTLDCLRALYDDLGETHAEVWVVDNASADGSADAIRAAFPQVRLIENPRNAGFGAANNLAITQARGEHLLLLNSDAFVHLGAVGALREYLRAHPQAGAVGPRLLNRDGSLQPSCHRFPSPLRAWLENLWVSPVLPPHHAWGDYRRWAHDTERSVDWVIGACLLVRRAACAQAGGFDESFFMYQEETDWQRRLRGAGWDIAFAPSAQVTHWGGASGAAEEARINAHFFESLDRYTRKHHGLPGLISLRLAMVAGAALRLLLWAAVALVVPKRRVAARAKTRLQAWLFVRQATHWRGAGTTNAGKAARA